MKWDSCLHWSDSSHWSVFPHWIVPPEYVLFLVTVTSAHHEDLVSHLVHWSQAEGQLACVQVLVLSQGEKSPVSWPTRHRSPGLQWPDLDFCFDFAACHY